jgi:hypothetical protein
MFYCPGCAKSKNWPESMFRSRGPCEVCHRVADCYETPSKDLPLAGLPAAKEN